jgi:hypothetical protein
MVNVNQDTVEGDQEPVCKEGREIRFVWGY